MQGEVLTPILFLLFVNDIENEFIVIGCADMSFRNLSIHGRAFVRSAMGRRIDPSWLTI